MHVRDLPVDFLWGHLDAVQRKVCMNAAKEVLAQGIIISHNSKEESELCYIEPRCAFTVTLKIT